MNRWICWAASTGLMTDGYLPVRLDMAGGEPSTGSGPDCLADAGSGRRMTTGVRRPNDATTALRHH